MNKRPTKAARRSAARLLLQEAERQLKYAAAARERAAGARRPDIAATDLKFANHAEARAATWASVADWILDA